MFKIYREFIIKTYTELTILKITNMLKDKIIHCKEKQDYYLSKKDNEKTQKELSYENEKFFREKYVEYFHKEETLKEILNIIKEI